MFAQVEIQVAWNALYDACPWATVFQSFAFVTTWFQVYRTKYLPIVVKAECGGKLIGLLTLTMPASGSGHLALSNRKEVIMGAGTYEAEYHTWLANASYGESFIKAALLKVQQQFPESAIHLRFIPSQAPLQWIQESPWKSYCVL